MDVALAASISKTVTLSLSFGVDANFINHKICERRVGCSKHFPLRDLKHRRIGRDLEVRFKNTQIKKLLLIEKIY